MVDRDRQHPLPTHLAADNSLYPPTHLADNTLYPPTHLAADNSLYPPI